MASTWNNTFGFFSLIRFEISEIGSTQPISLFTYITETRIVSSVTASANSSNFTLPASGHTIVLKTQTPHLLETIEAKTKEMNRKYKNAGLDFETYAKLICYIDSVNGNKLNQFDLEHLISGLAAKDMQKILNNIDAMSRAFGLDTNIYVTCAKCGAEIKTFFRHGPDFFRPAEI